MLGLWLTFRNAGISSLVSSMHRRDNDRERAGPHASIVDAVEGTIRMARITGIGGVFFRSHDSSRLYSWYDQNLGIQRDPNLGGSACFPWRPVGDPETPRMTVWSIFP